MTVKLTHLQLIYGVAGARERFEELTTHLIRSERPDAERIRVVRGDGGIDAHEGSLADSAGVDVYQMKFFPDGVGDSQKKQIRDSFNRVRENKSFVTKSWRLCLPVDMSIKEKKWFDEWQEKQTDTDIEMRPAWCALDLEGLLYMEKNRELREAFFKEEHLKQIREMRGLMRQLLDDFSAIIPSPIELKMSPTEVKVLKSYKFPNVNEAVIDLEMGFLIQNLSTTQTCRTWNCKARSVGGHDDRILGRRDYPVSGFSSYVRFDSAIAPTCGMSTEVHFGLKVDLDEPIGDQLKASTSDLEILFHPIPDNLVGEEQASRLLDVIAISDLVKESERSLGEGGIDYRP